MKRYHPLLVSLHWLVAILVIGSLFMGEFILEEISNTDPFKVTALFAHMAIGLSVLVLMLVRLIVRHFTKRPPEADIGHATLNKLGRWAHWALYILVIAMAGSGLATAQLAGLPDIVFGGSGAPLPKDFSNFAPQNVHDFLAGILGWLILAHVAAALFHQFVRKDGLMARMRFGPRS